MDFTPTLTYLIIAVNGVVSLTALYVAPGFLEKGYLKPYRVVRENTWYELISSGFLHSGLGHLFVNMLTLFFFGRILEQVLGPVYFLGLYFTGLILSSVPSLIKFKDDPNYATLGASGAVSAVLFAFIFIFPLQSIYLMFIPIPIPAFVFGVLYLLYSMYASKQERGRINHEAHTAGAFWGVLYMIIFVPESVNRLMRLFGG